MYSNDLGAICVEGLLERIVVDPKVMSGKPVIHGTRIAVGLISIGYELLPITCLNPSEK